CVRVILDHRKVLEEKRQIVCDESAIPPGRSIPMSFVESTNGTTERKVMKDYRSVAAGWMLIFISLLLGLPRNITNGQSEMPSYKDPSLPIEKRVDDLVSRMTLAEKVSQMMNAAPAIDRLDIPEYEWWNEALHGVARAGYATVFPQAIGLAAAWDTTLMHRVADV